MISAKSSIFLLAVAFACMSRGQDSNDSDGEMTMLVYESDGDVVELSVGDEIVFNFTIIDGLTDRYLLRSSSERVFEAAVVGSKDNEVSVNVSFQVAITGKFLGIEDLEFVDAESGEVAGTHTVRVKRVLTALNSAFNIIILIWLIISYLSMGGLMDWPKLKERLIPPWAILIGMFCQFIIMPLITFILARVLPVDNPTAVGIVLVGTCPGGWLSNIFSVLLDVDFVLSVTMTFFSSIVGMFMMPFNIWLYASTFIGDDNRLQTPFSQLILNLVLLIVACLVGILLGWKFEKFRLICEKVLKPVAVILIVFGLGLGIPADIHMFYSEWPIWVAAFSTPLIGSYFGLSLARIFAMPFKQSVTIALETGVQNALLARTVVALFYPQPEGDLVGRIQTLTVLITLVEGVIISSVYQLVRYLWCRFGGERDEKEDAEAAVQENGGKNGKKGTEGTQNRAFEAEKA